MSEQIIAYGGEVERSADNTAWETIPECKEIAVPSVTTEYVEVTNLDSVGGYREYIKGLKDPGEITLSCGYTAEGYEQQLADQNAADAIYYRVTMRPQPAQSTGDVFTFRGFPTPQLEAGDIGGAVNMNVVIRITGNVTWARGTDAA